MSHEPTLDRYAVERVCQDPAAVSAVYQPVVDLDRAAVWGYELLGSISGAMAAPTAMWFAAAAEYGLEGALEARIVRSGLSALGQLPAGQLLSINVTPQALRSPQLRAALRGHERFDSAILEVGERHLGEEDLAASLEPFRSAGGRLAIDALASGPTRLRRLVELRPDVLKLDRSLVSGIDADPAKAAVAELVAGLGRQLDAAVAAVGVERQEEVDVLRGIGITLAQGFLLGRRHASIAEAEARWRSAAS